jgi:hypothetical protein
MAAGLVEKQVDGSTYEFEKWGAEESLATLAKILKIVGKPLSQLVGSFGSEDGKKLLDQEIDSNLLGSAIGSLMESMDEGSTLALIKKLSSEKVLCDGAKISFNLHYQDRLDHLFRVVKAALEVQYGNFLAALFANLGVRRTQSHTIQAQTA